MTAVTVTSVIGTTAHFTFMPRADLDVAGQGITVPLPLIGWVNTAFDPAWMGAGWSYDVPSQTASFTLDDAFRYDVRIDFRNAPPVAFDGFIPENGDLLTQLTAQGWNSL